MLRLSTRYPPNKKRSGKIKPWELSRVSVLNDALHVHLPPQHLASTPAPRKKEKRKKKTCHLLLHRSLLSGGDKANQKGDL